MVFLLTGLSGGTGSGCFLDISYIVRGIIERDHGSAGIDRVNTLGYLFTPDVNLSNKSLSEHTRIYSQKRLCCAQRAGLLDECRQPRRAFHSEIRQYPEC